MNLLTAHTRDEVVRERDWDRDHGTLVREHITDTDTVAWIEYTNRLGQVVHFEHDGGAL